ncbi:hypothetical protein F4861DRAFT_167480 [Xylaria intraflava]|nr:hypothetical protein F4861DRAFT_167480 [Xylaria intraflava]
MPPTLLAVALSGRFADRSRLDQYRVYSRVYSTTLSSLTRTPDAASKHAQAVENSNGSSQAVRSMYSKVPRYLLTDSSAEGNASCPCSPEPPVSVKPHYEIRLFFPLFFFFFFAFTALFFNYHMITARLLYTVLSTQAEFLQCIRTSLKSSVLLEFINVGTPHDAAAVAHIYCSELIRRRKQKKKEGKKLKKTKTKRLAMQTSNYLILVT